MDVHQWHGNLPLKTTDNSVRLSVVCYLRTNIWKQESNATKSNIKKHIKILDKLTKKRKSKINKKTKKNKTPGYC